ncbi:MAG: ABC transporter permease [Anaerolineae bacterium]|nr:ABC transporter permease [Anaerolineae bacterium]
MKTLLVARKNLLEIIREPKLLALVVLTPLAFVGILAVGYNVPMLATHPLAVNTITPAGEGLLADLASQHYADGRPVFAVTPTVDPVAAETALKSGDATALLTIAETDDGLNVTVRGDPLSLQFYRASLMLDNTFYRAADQLAGRPQVVKVVEQPLFKEGPRSEFDLYAPGMIVFALLLIIPQTAMLVAREIRWHTLRRLRLTPLHAGELLTGIGLAQMAVAVVLVVLVFVAAILMGYHNQGELWLAMVVGLAVSFSALGLGLLVACFIENDSQAINLGSTVAMTQVFLSGSFYQLPPLTLFVLLGHQIDLFDIFPATHGFLALQQVLSYGVGLKEIGFRLAATLILSILYLAAGVIIFQHLQMKERRT